MNIISHQTSDRLDRVLTDLQDIHADLYSDERYDINLSKLSERLENVGEQVSLIALQCQIELGKYAISKLEPQTPPADDIPF